MKAHNVVNFSASARNPIQKFCGKSEVGCKIRGLCALI